MSLSYADSASSTSSASANGPSCTCKLPFFRETLVALATVCSTSAERRTPASLSAFGYAQAWRDGALAHRPVRRFRVARLRAIELAQATRRGRTTDGRDTYMLEGKDPSTSPV